MRNNHFVAKQNEQKRIDAEPTIPLWRRLIPLPPLPKPHMKACGQG